MACTRRLAAGLIHGLRMMSGLLIVLPGRQMAGQIGEALLLMRTPMGEAMEEVARSSGMLEASPLHVEAPLQNHQPSVGLTGMSLLLPPPTNQVLLFTLRLVLLASSPSACHVSAARHPKYCLEVQLDPSCCKRTSCPDLSSCVGV